MPNEARPEPVSHLTVTVYLYFKLTDSFVKLD
jgi:hypothetical protein